MNATIERVGLICAGAGLGAKLLTASGLWGWALGLGLVAALGAYIWKRWLFHPAAP